jgi:hypothetical protein
MVVRTSVSLLRVEQRAKDTRGSAGDAPHQLADDVPCVSRWIVRQAPLLGVSGDEATPRLLAPAIAGPPVLGYRGRPYSLTSF